MQSKQPRLRAAAVATGVFALSLVGVASAGSGYVVRNGTVAGSGDIVANDCFTLSSTIGEPAAGSISNGSITVTAGFQATTENNVIVLDTIFKNGFDSPQGNCSL
ncbi:hypothetical protein [Dokdonella sp.]|uniref:hypothetical protein n=1 Tax=Dokdonella sp. TaxID=2291710 RepID=UPI003C554FEB